MKKEDVLSFLWSSVKTMVGCAMFAVGFNMFLEPANLNAGGVAGLAMVFGHLFNFSATGLITALINIPLFLILWISPLFLSFYIISYFLHFVQ